MLAVAVGEGVVEFAEDEPVQRAAGAGEDEEGGVGAVDGVVAAGGEGGVGGRDAVDAGDVGGEDCQCVSRVYWWRRWDKGWGRSVRVGVVGVQSAGGSIEGAKALIARRTALCTPSAPTTMEAWS